MYDIFKGLYSTLHVSSSNYFQDQEMDKSPTCQEHV